MSSSSQIKSGAAPDIKKKEIHLLKKIGEGQFGQVFEGKCRGVSVAVKVLHELQMTEEDIVDFKSEVGIMVHLRHPNILLLLGACYEPGEFMIVTELMMNDLDHVIHGPNDVSLAVKIKLSKDVANGLAWLHLSNPPIIHRDIKPGNILVDFSMNAKLADFGLSCIQAKKNFRDDGDAPGSPLWMSPEVLLGEVLNETADIYAYAIVVWELLTEEDPFSQYDSIEPFINAVCFEKERPPLPRDMHSQLKSLLRACWDEDVDVRPSANQISEQLDEIVLDVCIDDSDAREMWRSNFPGKSTTSKVKFVQAFYRYLKIEFPSYAETDIEHKCLISLFPDDDVSVTQFGDFLVWFGPFDSSILDRLRDLLAQPWFFGDISREEAESKLDDVAKGKNSYLIRMSTNDPRVNPFTLSLIRKQIMHMRIKQTSSGYRIIFKKAGKTIKANEPDLKTLIKTITRPLGLGDPCLGRKYKTIFDGTDIVSMYEAEYSDSE